MPTPNFIKYSTTPDSSGIKVGNYTIGVFSGGTYGPTSTTNYWNGVSPPISGYTIYENKSANGPSIRVASNDTVLIDYANRLYSGTGITTEYSALTYLNSLGSVICVNRDYEEMITSGLTLNLDAGFTPSYPKSGTTWNSVSFSGNNGTLVNGPTYSTDGGGSIVFDGVDDYVSTTYSSNVAFLNRSPYTLEVFVNPLSVSQYPGWIDREGNLGSGRDGYNLIYSQFGIPAGSVYVFTERFTTGSATQAGATVTTSSFFGYWSHLVSTYDGSTLALYMNGILMASSTSSGNITNNSTALQIGRRGVTSSSGKIAISRIYNRALTNVEILQNYQTQFPRFLGENIITNGLVFYVDSGYRPSYPTTGTTWYDVSGYGRNGTLTNGPAYSGTNGGSLVFDGTDDFVSTSVSPTALGMIGGSFTVCCWFYCDNLSITNGGLVNSYTANSAGNAYEMGVRFNSLWVGFYGGDQYVGLQNNTWYCVVHTYNFTTKSSKVYVNDVLSSTLTRTVNLSSTGNIRIGVYGSNDLNFNGKINIVQIYNRELSSTEVTKNFNAQKSRFGL